MKEIRFTCTDEEAAEIRAYVQAKRRWKQVSHFVRDATFQAMERYPARQNHGKSIGGTAQGLQEE